MNHNAANTWTVLLSCPSNTTVQVKISEKEEKMNRKTQKFNGVTSMPKAHPTPVNNSLSALPVTLNGITNSFEKFTISAHSTLSRTFDASLFGFGKKNKKRTSVDKANISTPTDFKHVGHVGIGKNNFDVNILLWLLVERSKNLQFFITFIE